MDKDGPPLSDPNAKLRSEVGLLISVTDLLSKARWVASFRIRCFYIAVSHKKQSFENSYILYTSEGYLGSVTEIEQSLPVSKHIII